VGVAVEKTRQQSNCGKEVTAAVSQGGVTKEEGRFGSDAHCLVLNCHFPTPPSAIVFPPLR
jgi:hypothetical protein